MHLLQWDQCANQIQTLQVQLQAIGKVAYLSLRTVDNMRILRQSNLTYEASATQNKLCALVVITKVAEEIVRKNMWDLIAI